MKKFNNTYNLYMISAPYFCESYHSKKGLYNLYFSIFFNFNRMSGAQTSVCYVYVKVYVNYEEKNGLKIMMRTPSKWISK
jgi:hypothetical protein